MCKPGYVPKLHTGRQIYSFKFLKSYNKHPDYLDCRNTHINISCCLKTCLKMLSRNPFFVLYKKTETIFWEDLPCLNKFIWFVGTYCISNTWSRNIDELQCIPATTIVTVGGYGQV